MASTIGTIMRQDDGSYVGTLKTLTVRANIRLVPTGETGDKPTHRIYAESGFELGAAWTKTKKDNGGGTYLSLKFDAPELPQVLYCNAGRAPGQDDDDVYVLIWNRRD